MVHTRTHSYIHSLYNHICLPFYQNYFSRQGFYEPQLTMNYVAEIGPPFSLPQAPVWLENRSEPQRPVYLQLFLNPESHDATQDPNQNIFLASAPVEWVFQGWKPQRGKQWHSSLMTGNNLVRDAVLTPGFDHLQPLPLWEGFLPQCSVPLETQSPKKHPQPFEQYQDHLRIKVMLKPVRQPHLLYRTVIPAALETEAGGSQIEAQIELYISLGT